MGDESISGGWSRRTFLAGAGALGLAVAAGCSDDSGGSKGSPTTRRSGAPDRSAPRKGVADPKPKVALPDELFTLGVASGDPLPNAVVLWTRLAPEPLAGGGMPDTPVDVRWQVATDERFAKVVADGLATAAPDHAHSVHVDATGLEPGTPYFYRFTIGGRESPVGRTRTAPAKDAAVDRLRFVFASCQDWKDGYWTSWPHALDEDVDLVAFLGDYIYESGPDGDVRDHNSAEVVDLAGYRDRYGLYKGDPGLQALHAAAPWVVTWDDHEVDNNYAGETPETDAPVQGAAFATRRAAGYQAFWEHSPVRTPPPRNGSLKLYRSFRWGRLAHLVVLDGRQYRSDQPCDAGDDIGGDCAQRTAADQTMLGAAQKRWLERELRTTGTTYQVLANQTIMTPLPIGPVYNLDQWDGYAAERDDVVDMLARAENPVVITGDIHASGVGDVRKGAEGSPTQAAELVGTSISSSFDPTLLDAAEPLLKGLDQVKYFDGRHRGYVRCDVTSKGLTAAFRMVESTTSPESAISTTATFAVEPGRRGAQEA